jgi:spore coat protein A, manganese oxidase
MQPSHRTLAAAAAVAVILISLLAAPTLAWTPLANATPAAESPAALAQENETNATPTTGRTTTESTLTPTMTAEPGGNGSALGAGPAAIPGRIEAENYDAGGQDVTWYDRTPGNQGGAYREDDVDIASGGSGHVVTKVKSSEWLSYAVDVAEAGTYTATVRAASPWDEREVWVWVDGDLRTQVAVPKTGSLDAYEDATAEVALTAGSHILRIEFFRDAQNLDYTEFATTGGGNATPEPTGTATPGPTATGGSGTVTEPNETPTMTPMPPSNVSEGGDGELLDASTIPKFVSQLDPVKVYEPTEVTDPVDGGTAHAYHVTMSQFEQQVLPPGFPTTTMWGYGGDVTDLVTGNRTADYYHSTSPAFVATRGVPSIVTWTNNITQAHHFPVDPTIHWADPNGLGLGGMAHNASMELHKVFPSFPPGFPEAQSPVPLVPHLHGGEVPSRFDGNPEAWWTWNGLRGDAFNSLSSAGEDSAVFRYPNEQPAAPLWYHDHALGITRLNVASGLAGGYLIKDPSDPIEQLLPSGRYEVPLIIQDRSFYQNGSLWFPSEGINPDVHPYWNPENFGETIMVNGKVWPNLDVDNGQYRFYLYDGSNARFYTLRFEAQGPGNKQNTTMPFVQIASDGGYLPEPVEMTELTIAPGERAVVLIDFKTLPKGTKVLMTNTASAPFPGGDPADPETTGQVMQFTVTDQKGFKTAKLPATLNEIPAVTPEANRTLVLWESMGENGPVELLLNGLNWSAPVTETPALGSTEEWDVVNPTADTHPIHLHLVQFLVVNRQAMDTEAYAADWTALNANLSVMGDGMPQWNGRPEELDPAPYLTGDPMPPAPNEAGWKDTVKMNAGEVTRIRARFAPIDGSGTYPFDATEGPGYVWHCHILDHEDNEMMRLYIVTR